MARASGARAYIARLRKPRVTTLLAGVSIGLTLLRFLVLLCESYALVTAERAADRDLLALCARGAASESGKFRALCLEARAAGAAPVVLKATLKAVRIAFRDFLDVIHNPWRMLLLVVFLLSGLAVPAARVVAALAKAHAARPRRALARLHGADEGSGDEDDDEERSAPSIVVLNGGQRPRFASPHFLRSRRRLTDVTGGIAEGGGEDDDAWRAI
jgi:hypothetical protein